MIIIENYKEISNEGSYFIVTIPFEKDCPLLKVNYDVDSETIEVEGNQYFVNDCLVSDNGEWINLICDRISTKRERERLRIGRRIAEIRKDRGLSQVQLAELCGMHQGHIARIELGKYSVGLDTLANIAEAIGCKIDITEK